MVTLGAILLLNSKTSPPEYSWFVQAQLYFSYKIFGSKVKIEKSFFWVTGLWDKIVRDSRELLFKHNWRSRESRSPDRENEVDRQRRMWEENPVFVVGCVCSWGPTTFLSLTSCDYSTHQKSDLGFTGRESKYPQGSFPFCFCQLLGAVHMLWLTTTPSVCKASHVTSL